MGASIARIAEVNMFIYAELLSVPLKLAIFKQFVYLTVGGECGSKMRYCTEQLHYVCSSAGSDYQCSSLFS